MEYVLSKIKGLPNTRKSEGLYEAVELLIYEFKDLKTKVSTLEDLVQQLQKDISLTKEKETQDGKLKKSTTK